jgi:hypothetical protein
MATTRVELSESVYVLLSSGDNFLQNISNTAVRIVHAPSLPSVGSPDFYSLQALQGFATVGGLPSGNTYGRSEKGVTNVTVGV